MSHGPKGYPIMRNFLRRIPRSPFSLLYDEARLPKDIRRSLNLIVMGNLCGGLFGAICGCGTSAMIGLVNELHADDLAFGVINGIPQVAALLQIPFSMLVNRTHHRKKYMLTYGMLSRAIWLIFGFIPLIVPTSPAGLQLWTLIFLLGLSSCGGAIINVCWLPWFSDLAPISIRGRWMSIRDTITAITGLLFGFLVARLLDTLPAENRYIIIFIIGSIFGMIDMLCFGFCTEKYSTPPQRLHFSAVMKDIAKNKPFRNLLIMWTAWCFASNLCGPFLSRYSVNVLGLTFTQLMLFGTVASSVATVLVMTRWGKAANNYGCRSVMLVCAITAPLMDGFYIMARPGGAWAILLRNFLGAMFWSGCNLASSTMQLSTSSDEIKSSYIAVFSCITSLVGGAGGTLVGGFLLDSMEGLTLSFAGMDRYKVMILLSIVLRLLVAFLLVRSLENDRDGTPGQMVSAIIHGFHLPSLRRRRS